MYHTSSNLDHGDLAKLCVLFEPKNKNQAALKSEKCDDQGKLVICEELQPWINLNNITYTKVSNKREGLEISEKIKVKLRCIDAKPVIYCVELISYNVAIR